MGIANIHYLHGILFPSAAFISQLTDLSPETGQQDLVAYAAGHPDPLFVAAQAIAPKVRFSTPQLVTLNTLLGTPLAVDLSGGNTDLYYRLASDLGVRASGSVHTRMRMTQGLLYLDEISAQQDQVASATCQLIPTFDGTNLPIVPAGSQAIAGTSTAAENFTLGPAKINGSFIDGVKSMRLNMGIQANEERADGDDFSTFVGIQQRAPVLEITTTELAAWAAYTVAGIAVTAAIAYLRRKQPDGRNYSDASTQHIALTATNGRAYVTQTPGGANNPAMTTIRIPLRAASAAAEVVAITTGTAIT